jgi:AsmA protein
LNIRQKLSRPLRQGWRRAIVGLVVLLAIFVVFQVVAPSLISSSVVRQNMERAVARWTGHSVSIRGATDIRFWPKPRITLRDVTIRKGLEDGSERVLAHVGRLSAGFDLLEALRGNPQFRDFRLTEAEIFVVRDPSGRLDWANDGLLSQAVRKVEASGGQQTLEAASDAEVGDVKIRNGMLEITNQTDGRKIRLDGIEGSLDWPMLSGGLRLLGQANIEGQPLYLDIATPQPLLLLSGKSADAAVKVRSQLVTASFSGLTNLASQGFLSGNAEVSVADLPALLKWADVDLAAAAGIKALSLQARVIGSENALRLEDLALGLNGIDATGILDLTMPEGKRPRITGTLATGTIDLSPLLGMIGPSLREGDEEARRLQTSAELDVRLSAQQATIGPFQFYDLALGVMSIGEQSRLDILDSSFQSGRLTGRLATIKGGPEGALALRLMVKDADFTDIIQRLQLKGPLPAGRGSMDISVDVARPLTTATWRNAKGSVHFTGEAGVLAGVDLASIRTLGAQKPYFALSETAGAALEYQSIDLAAELSDGSAEIKKGQITTSTETIALAGIVPYVNNSLALSAIIRPLDNAQSTSEGLFIGGSWPDPVIWPLPQNQPRAAD